jgi:hypothetical protein
MEHHPEQVMYLSERLKNHRTASICVSRPAIRFQPAGSAHDSLNSGLRQSTAAFASA